MYRLLLIAALLWCQSPAAKAASGWGGAAVSPLVVIPQAAGWLLPRVEILHAYRANGLILLKAGVAHLFSAQSPADSGNAPAQKRAQPGPTPEVDDAAAGEAFPLISLLAAAVLLPLIILIAVARTLLTRRL